MVRVGKLISNIRRGVVQSIGNVLDTEEQFFT